MNKLRGALPLARLIVARDRARMLAWVVGIVALVVATAASTKGIYPTQASLDEAAAIDVANPVALAFNGPAQALDTMGGQIAFQVGAFGMVVVGLMTLLLVGRLTRGEEDSGRLELVRSMPVGRHAPFAAGVLVVTALNVILGVVVATSLLVEDLPVRGSIVLGASYTAFGIAFIGVTAVAAQVTENPRVATGAAGALLGLAFALRAVGDARHGTLSWLSPIGWAQRARPYAGERWWPLAMLLVLGVGLLGVAVVLAGRRDFGAGLVAPNPGPPVAAPGLRSPLALATRLHRAAALWWCVGIVSLAAVYGSLAHNIDAFVSDNQALKDVFAGYGKASLTDSYLTTSLLITALVAAGPALQIAARLRTEEAAQRAEPILATPATRLAWAGSHIGVAFAAGTLALALGGAGLGAAYAFTGGGLHQVARLTAAALVYAPAIWLLTAVAVAIFGLAPRWTAVAWTALAGCSVIAMFGALLRLDRVILDLSPFQHTPAAPADAVRLLPIAVMTALAAGLTAVGLAAFRSRDLLIS